MIPRFRVKSLSSGDEYDVVKIEYSLVDENSWSVEYLEHGYVNNVVMSSKHILKEFTGVYDKNNKPIYTYDTLKDKKGKVFTYNYMKPAILETCEKIDDEGS